MTTKPTLTVVVPVYNEAEGLPTFLSELIPACEANGWQAILVDDGSTDESPKLLAAYGNLPFVKLIHHKVNRGYGGALKSGLSNAKTSHVVTIDGDGQHNLDDITTVFRFALEHDADLVVGDRGRWKKASWFRETGKWLIRNIARMMMPLNIHDLNSGFKLYRTELVRKYLTICPNSMAFSDVITAAFISRRDLVLEHPITIRVRKTGQSTIGIHTALETVIEIVNIVLLFNPLKIFLPVSIACMLVGFAWGLPIALMGRGVSVGAMLAIVVGALLSAIGLLASQLSAIRMERLEDFNHGTREETHAGTEGREN